MEGFAPMGQGMMDGDEGVTKLMPRWDMEDSCIKVARVKNFCRKFRWVQLLIRGTIALRILFANVPRCGLSAPAYSRAPHESQG